MTGRDDDLLRAEHDQRLQTVGTLAAGIAHDFNNVLTAILGHASLLSEGLPGDHPERPAVDEIIAGTNQAAALVRQLLSFTRSRERERQPVDLNVVAQDMHSLLGRVIGVDVQLQLDLDPALCRVCADPAQIAQVLMNLIMNARDALPGGRGHIRVRTRTRNGGIAGRRCRFATMEVEDDGVGMSGEVRARMFDRYFSTKDRRQSSGLGMAIVADIVSRHEGHIEVQSEPGVGTSIRIHLPAID